MLYGKNLIYLNDSETKVKNFNHEMIWVKQINVSEIFLEEKNIFLESEMHSRDICLYGDINWNNDCEPQSLIFEVKGLVTYYLKKNDPILYFSKDSNYHEKKANFWLFHTILPIFLILKGYYEAVLHCGSVVVDGKAILFVAPSMGGKSTLTDYFISQGHKMISDDRVAISHTNGTFQVIHSYAFCRPYRNFEDLGKEVDNIEVSPLPVHAVYILEKADKETEVEIYELKGMDKFLALLQSSEVNFPFQKPKIMDTLASMANMTPIYKVYMPWDKDRLDEVYSIIQTHLK